MNEKFEKGTVVTIKYEKNITQICILAEDIIANNKSKGYVHTDAYVRISPVTTTQALFDDDIYICSNSEVSIATEAERNLLINKIAEILNKL